MRFMIQMTNELPFTLEIPNGEYEIPTSLDILTLNINSDMYNLHTARFAKYAGKSYAVGEDEELQKIIETDKLPNYAFANCKTFVSCTKKSEKDFVEADYSKITEEQCIETIAGNFVSNHVEPAEGSNITQMAKNYYSTITDDEKSRIVQQILIQEELSKLSCVYAYYEALNKLIHQYSYLRKHFWVHRVDENILEGTLVQKYVNGKFYESITYAGLVPSIMPYKKKYPEMNATELADFKDRLANNYEIPIENDLMLVARSLWYRAEYRSAVIESSAALEIAVEKKIVEKMTALGKTTQEIDDELKFTENNFPQRCAHYLKKYTGKSFKDDNSTLWAKIDQHRKLFRHKIAHSTVTPDKMKTEEIINDFENAIIYICSL